MPTTTCSATPFTMTSPRPACAARTPSTIARSIPAKDDATRIEYVDTWVSYPGRYKGSDTFSPMGPWLTTRDQVPDPHALTVSCRHRDDLVTQDSTANLFYKVPEVLAFLSQFMTLLPGDCDLDGHRHQALRTRYARRAERRARQARRNRSRSPLRASARSATRWSWCDERFGAQVRASPRRHLLDDGVARTARLSPE